MKFSVWPNPNRPTSEVLDLARYADASGWFGVWYADHYMPNSGTEEVLTGDTHECWAVLPAIAAVTSNLRLGPLVAPTSVHHPAVLANRAVTIDHVSDGRFVLGLGAGWQVNEHAAFGIELEPAGARVTRFEESIQIVRSMLDRERTTFEGRVFTIRDAPCDPKPLQAKLPILVGTGSPRMLRITARHAQEWNTWGHPPRAAERRAAFESACSEVGTDPATMHTSVQALVHRTDDDAAARAIRDDDAGWRSIAGSDDYVVDQLGRYAEMGFDEFILPDWNLGDSPEQRRDAIESFRVTIGAQFAEG